MILVGIGSACATAGTRPHDMGAAEHERAANNEERIADYHEDQYDPAGTTTGGTCSSYCFDTWTNPTSRHADEARRHRKLADKHRRASERLRDAEALACGGIPDRDRDVSPFLHAADIESVDVTARGDRKSYVVRFRPIPGVDAGGMQRLLDCHIARNAVLGGEMPQMEYCPLVVPGVAATVVTRGAGVAVQIEAGDPDGAAALESRIEALRARLRDGASGQ